MNFGDVIKKEIIEKPIKDNDLKKAFLAGLIRGAGSLYSSGEDFGLLINLSGENTAMLLFSLLRSIYDYEVREVSVEEDRFNKKDRFNIYMSGDEALDILDDLKILNYKDGEVSVNFNFFNKITEKEGAFNAFIRGIFLSAGGCTVPDNNGSNTGYHLEITFSRPETASAFNEKLLTFNIPSKIIRRKDNFVLYIKSAEEIKDFLALLPAPVSVLKLTDIMIEKEIINDSNRRTNCDIANITRQLEAQEKCISAINKIKNSVGLDSLKKELKETAKARIEFSGDTLTDLAKRLNVTKSCLNHRLRKIISIAKEIE